MDYLFFGLVLMIVFMRLPSILKNYETEGKLAPNIKVEFLSGEQKLLSEIKGKKILVFWTTWCPPCKVEIGRLHNAISDGELSEDKVILVNMGQKKKDVLKYYQKNEYMFKTIMDYDSILSNQLEVSVTPSVIHIDEKNVIDHVGTGLSPMLIYRAQFFLD